MIRTRAKKITRTSYLILSRDNFQFHFWFRHLIFTITTAQFIRILWPIITDEKKLCMKRKNAKYQIQLIGDSVFFRLVAASFQISICQSIPWVFIDPKNRPQKEPVCRRFCDEIGEVNPFDE